MTINLNIGFNDQFSEALFQYLYAQPQYQAIWSEIKPYDNGDEQLCSAVACLELHIAKTVHSILSGHDLPALLTIMANSTHEYFKDGPTITLPVDLKGVSGQ